MFCNKCGKEIPDEAKFCQECGTVVGAGEKKSFIKMIVSPKVYYPAMVILVLIAVFMGRLGAKKTETKELKELLSATEDTVADFFSVDKNDMGFYPNEASVIVTCDNGKTSMINISTSIAESKKYQFFGVGVGEEGQAANELLMESGFYFIDEQDMGDQTYNLYTDNAGNTLTVVLDSDGKVYGLNYLFETVEEMLEPAAGDMDITDEDNAATASPDLENSADDVAVDDASSEAATDDTAFSGEDAGDIQESEIYDYEDSDEIDSEVYIDFLYYAVVTASDGYVNMRMGQGTDFAVIREISTNELLEVIEDHGKWLYVRYSDGGEEYLGWVAASQVSGVQ